MITDEQAQKFNRIVLLLFPEYATADDKRRQEINEAVMADIIDSGINQMLALAEFLQAHAPVKKKRARK